MGESMHGRRLAAGQLAAGQAGYLECERAAGVCARVKSVPPSPTHHTALGTGAAWLRAHLCPQGRDFGAFNFQPALQPTANLAWQEDACPEKGAPTPTFRALTLLYNL